MVVDAENLTLRKKEGLAWNPPTSILKDNLLLSIHISTHTTNSHIFPTLTHYSFVSSVSKCVTWDQSLCDSIRFPSQYSCLCCFSSPSRIPGCSTDNFSNNRMIVFNLGRNIQIFTFMNESLSFESIIMMIWISASDTKLKLQHFKSTNIDCSIILKKQLSLMPH